MTPQHELVLHHVAIKGRAAVPVLASRTGLEVADVEGALGALVAEGLVEEKRGPAPGYAPTEEGKRRHDEVLSRDELRRRRDELGSWYAEFEELNAQLKELCTAWQIVDGPGGLVPNDHSDRDRDDAIVRRLASLHERAAALLRRPGHERLTRYERCLAQALEAVQRGELERFTAPLCESYHDVWMELHHDVLLSLDRRRTAADA
jgi:DNA-binding MarR family transcriptional regulator